MQTTKDRTDRPPCGALSFRQVQTGDWALLFRAYQQAQETPFFTAFADDTVHLCATSFVEYCCCKGRELWVIQREDRPIGFVLLLDVDATNQSANMDVVFFETTVPCGSQEVAVVGDLLRQACDKHGLTRLQVVALETNAARLALVQALGFQKEGVLREQFHWQGAPCDLIFLARLER